MPSPHVLASGIVEPGAGTAGGVVAFVAVNFGLDGSRIFKLHGPANAPKVDELPSTTTVNLAQFQIELNEELQGAIDVIKALGGTVAITQPSAHWVCGHIRTHLRQTQGIDLDEPASSRR